MPSSVGNGTREEYRCCLLPVGWVIHALATFQGLMAPVNTRSPTKASFILVSQWSYPSILEPLTNFKPPNRAPFKAEGNNVRLSVTVRLLDRISLFDSNAITMASEQHKGNHTMAVQNRPSPLPFFLDYRF
uniref:Uncharacterized protein n=1 Tax=Panagrellus redivivus TaxID=6233 RepID=A0A7E4VDK8_PANRE